MKSSVQRASKYSKELLEEAVAQCDTLSGVLVYLGLGPRGGSYKHIGDKIRELGIPWPHYKGLRSGRGGHRLSLEKVFNSNRRLNVLTLKRALSESGVTYSCAECGQSSIWNGKPLSLQVDHINGNSCDNSLTNLRYLCPNCHTQTTTFGSKNKGPQKPDFVGVLRPSSEIRVGSKTLYKHICPVCGLEFHRSQKFADATCSRACMGVRQTKAMWPSDEKLRAMVWETPVQTIAKSLGVTGNSVKKHCSKLGIPLPGRGYWQKRSAGKV